MQKYCEFKDGCLLVHMPKELDHHEAGQIKLETDLLIDAYHMKTLIFDFGETEFMDSSGVGVIIGRCRSVSYYGGEVYAQNLNGRMKKIFLVSGLHKLIRMERPKRG